MTPRARPPVVAARALQLAAHHLRRPHHPLPPRPRPARHAQGITGAVTGGNGTAGRRLLDGGPLGRLPDRAGNPRQAASRRRPAPPPGPAPRPAGPPTAGPRADRAARPRGPHTRRGHLRRPREPRPRQRAPRIEQQPQRPHARITLRRQRTGQDLVHLRRHYPGQLRPTPRVPADRRHLDTHRCTVEPGPRARSRTRQPPAPTGPPARCRDRTPGPGRAHGERRRPAGVAPLPGPGDAAPRSGRQPGRNR